MSRFGFGGRTIEGIPWAGLVNIYPGSFLTWNS